MRRFALPVLLIALAAACRAGGGSSSSSPAASTGALESSLQAFHAAFQAVSVGLTVAFTQGTSPGGPITEYKHTLLCDTSGPENEGTSNIEARIQDNTVEGTFFVSTNLKNCGDVNGDLDAVGSFTRASGQTSLDWDYSGIIRSGDCDVDLSDVTVSSVQSTLAASSVSGTLTADCGSATVECDWNQTPAQDEAALLISCSCSGSGC
jgi:hypothetical protein